MKLIAFVAALFVAVPVFADEATVRAHRSHYPSALSADDAPKLLFDIAVDLNRRPGAQYGLLRKTTGNNCGGWACDILCAADGRHWDVFIDGPSDGQPGPSAPAWQDKGMIDDPARCEVAVGAPIPDPPPPPPPLPACDSDAAATPLLERLATLQATADATRDSLEEHRAEVRKARNKVLAWLGNWRNLVTVIAGIAGGFGLAK